MCLSVQNEIGQSRWDHPLDPHFRRIYLRERFRTTADEDSKELVLGREALAETPAQGSGLAIGRSTCGASDLCGGPAGGDRATNIHGGGRPPVMLPPRRMRPSMLDFPADKALENLRARRLNVSGSNGSRSTFAAVTTASAVAVTRSASGPQINNNPAVTANSGGGSHYYHSGGDELWTDGQGRSGNEPPASPVGPRRRRPVSASAVREGLVERSQALKSSAGEVAHRGHSEASRGGGDRSASTMVHRGSLTFDSQQDQRTRRGGGGGAGGGSTTTSRTQRPRSARATLQRPPPVASDYHHQTSKNGDDRGGCQERYNYDRFPQQQQQQSGMTNRVACRSRPSSTAPPPDRWDDEWAKQGVANSRNAAGVGGSGGGGGGAMGGGAQTFSRQEGGARDAELLGSGGKGVTTWPVGEREAEGVRHSPEEEERAWLRSR